VKLKIAVVGLGKMGLLHASILSSMSNVELSALCEKKPLIRRFGKKVFRGIDLVDDLGKLSGMGLDAVYVTTPVFSHFPIVRAIYTEGIARNVFVEKPLASNYTEAQVLCSLAAACGGSNMVGYNRRFSVTFRKAREILNQGILGQLTSFEGYAYSSDFWGAKNILQTSTRGGVLRDSGCHIIDVAVWFFGQLKVKSAKIESIVCTGSEDSVYIKVDTPSGLEGELKCSWCMEKYRLPEMGLLVKGSNGTMKVNEDKVELEIDGKDPGLWYKHDLNDNVPFFIGGADYYREDESFVNSIGENRTNEPDFLVASEVEKIIDQVRDSKQS
jgi:predicted dehydrogenase